MRFCRPTGLRILAGGADVRLLEDPTRSIQEFEPSVPFLGTSCPTFGRRLGPRGAAGRNAEHGRIGVSPVPGSGLAARRPAVREAHHGTSFRSRNGLAQADHQE